MRSALICPLSSPLVRAFSCAEVLTARSLASSIRDPSTRSFFTLESDSIDKPFWKDLIVRESDGKFYDKGHLKVSDKPGLGIELNEEVCKAHLTPGTSFFK